MSKNKIYIKNWLKFKPYENQTFTDGYYLKLCNRVQQALLSSQVFVVFQMYLSKEEIDDLACFLTAWFEDLISGTNIWNSFINQSKHLYNKPLPFYEIEDYFEGEINLQDVKFLIWYFMNTAQTEKFISPYNDFIEDGADLVFSIFEDAWEVAPENEILKPFYEIDENADYYQARNLIDVLVFQSYLFYPDTLLRLIENEAELIEENEDDEHLLMFLNENRETVRQSSHTRLLSLKGKEWVAEMLGSDHPLYNDFLNLSQRIAGFFLYRGQDENDIFIEHIASGKKFNLTKKSFDHSEELTETDTILYMGIVQWQNEWWFSGVYFKQKFNADLVLDEKNSMESRKKVSFLDQQKKEVREMLENQFNLFLNFNKGEQIAFMPSDKITEFYTDFYRFFNKSLKMSDKQIEAAKKRSRDEGFFGKEDQTIDFSKDSETGLVFFNPNSGIEIALNVNAAFPLPHNPYFKEEDSEEHLIGLMMNESFSGDLVVYCIDNCKDKLRFFKTGVGKKYLENIDFLLRFWKLKNYFSEPSVTPIGKTE